jgi:hypothetical protein
MLNEPGGPQDVTALLIILLVIVVFSVRWVWNRFFSRRIVRRRLGVYTKRDQAVPMSREELKKRLDY